MPNPGWFQLVGGGHHASAARSGRTMARENRYVSSMYSLGGSAKCVEERKKNNNEKNAGFTDIVLENLLPKMRDERKGKEGGAFWKGGEGWMRKRKNNK